VQPCVAARRLFSMRLSELLFLSNPLPMIVRAPLPIEGCVSASLCISQHPFDSPCAYAGHLYRTTKILLGDPSTEFTLDQETVTHRLLRYVDCVCAKTVTVTSTRRVVCFCVGLSCLMLDWALYRILQIFDHHVLSPFMDLSFGVFLIYHLVLVACGGLTATLAIASIISVIISTCPRVNHPSYPNVCRA
jgi:hypothetical protein